MLYEMESILLWEDSIALYCKKEGENEGEMDMKWDR